MGIVRGLPCHVSCVFPLVTARNIGKEVRETVGGEEWEERDGWTGVTGEGVERVGGEGRQ